MPEALAELPTVPRNVIVNASYVSPLRVLRETVAAERLPRVSTPVMLPFKDTSIYEADVVAVEARRREFLIIFNAQRDLLVVVDMKASCLATSKTSSSTPRS